MIKKAIINTGFFSLEEVDLLVRFYTDIEMLMNDFKTTPVTSKSLLGDYYLDLQSVSQEDRDIMYDICKNGYKRLK